tara:strand:+ start:429 stop:1202 length:774 start_codon:yes stop_codon:yes gene_type:complete
VNKIISFTLASVLVVPNISANTVSSGLYNSTTQTYTIKENIHKIRPIASITKLFTAYTIIKSGVDLTEAVPLKGASSSRWNRNAQPIERIQLLHTMLMSSDNLAAESLANAHPGGFSQFLVDTNRLISELNLHNTTITDSTGLLSTNQSTIYDLNQFLIDTIANEPIIKSLSTTKQLTPTYKSTRSKTIQSIFNNTNNWINKLNNIILTKTGFTTPAGRCVAMLIYNNDTLYSLITLGNDSRKLRDRQIGNMIKQIH